MIRAKDIAAMIDHTLLRPDLTIDDVKAWCEIAVRYQTESVCARPTDVQQLGDHLKETGVALSTVNGFPPGTQTTSIQLAESLEAMEAGVVEQDMVMNYTRLLSGDLEYAAEEIEAITNAAHARGAIGKVIFENCYLTDEL